MIPTDQSIEPRDAARTAIVPVPHEEQRVKMRPAGQELRERIEAFTREQPVEAMVLALVAGVITGTALRATWNGLFRRSRSC